jgi:AraC-like DNA-binding protein
MDALSDVLSMLRVRSGLSSRFEGQGNWAFRFPAYEHMKFGTVLSGRLHLWMDGADTRHTLEEGDFWLMTSGRPFISASNPASTVVDGPAAYRASRGVDGVVRYQTSGNSEPVKLASGRFLLENNIAGMLLERLPPLILLRAVDIASHALGHVLALLKLETDVNAPGADVAQTSLAALVLVQALRAHAASEHLSDGWLKALADARVGTALSCMHSEPAERWTVESLATKVGMSRTAFANRFRQLVGTAPLEYLQQWRLAIATTALKTSEEPLLSIAERIGYQSDTAFSIAFKRAIGISPGRYRVAHRPYSATSQRHLQFGLSGSVLPSDQAP